MSLKKRFKKILKSKGFKFAAIAGAVGAVAFTGGAAAAGMAAKGSSGFLPGLAGKITGQANTLKSSGFDPSTGRQLFRGFNEDSRVEAARLENVGAPVMAVPASFEAQTVGMSRPALLDTHNTGLLSGNSTVVMLGAALLVAGLVYVAFARR